MNFMDQDEYGTEDEYKILGYPSSRIYKLKPKTTAILNMLTFSILIYFTLIRLFLKVTTKTAIMRSTIISSALFILVIENMLIS
jgi:hypothetical protein